jgi:hypothetical protein
VRIRFRGAVVETYTYRGRPRGVRGRDQRAQDGQRHGVAVGRRHGARDHGRHVAGRRHERRGAERGRLSRGAGRAWSFSRSRSSRRRTSPTRRSALAISRGSRRRRSRTGRSSRRRGGAAGETIDDAIARSVALGDPHVVNFGVGTYHDDLLDKDLSTAQLAPRIAGILAARRDQALTGAELSAGCTSSARPASRRRREVAVQRGVTLRSARTRRRPTARGEGPDDVHVTTPT